MHRAERGNGTNNNHFRIHRKFAAPLISYQYFSEMSQFDYSCSTPPYAEEWFEVADRDGIMVIDECASNLVSSPVLVVMTWDVLL